MARIASLAILASTTGNDYLAEQYGAVIQNIAKRTISQRIKNQNLSGDPTSGTVEAKRFSNTSSKAYGTARSGGAGEKLKAKPVVIAINTDRELIREVEAKDTKLYGVDGLVERQAAEDEKSITRELERAFFSEAVTAGTAVTLTETEIADKLEELIQTLEVVHNDYVDGVERSDMILVLAPGLYGKARTYFDKVEGGNATAESFNMFHGVRVESSVFLPDGTDAVLMVVGSVAQPVMFTRQNAERVPFSNAYAFGIFFSYGTKAVSEDLIFTVASA
jgi:hypothetical protein